ncbi:hypothetical protein C3F34_01625 [Acinetobacter sp. ACNIH2]|uniref:hypothetical protein n=1 Tax=Acinetobacter sp. ACNIH2 TaxID=1758189 RepID=UPI000CDBAE8D|nr:hypothetical protein [Acinetobacter sp. ACNIH2]AUX84898.1 hypothetical protein C3F34_01625 [Acinetobacter sp. ACNIH2]
MKNRFYLTSAHGFLGTNVVWHRHEGCGYHTDLDQAHVYTLKEAQEYWADSHGDCLPISADHVDALAVWKVDCQYIPKESQIIDGVYRYVAYEKKKWDGNDVYWMNRYSYPTTDFSQASTLDEVEAQAFLNSEKNFIVIPRYIAEKVKRRTFDYRQINKRKMVFGAGLKTPEIVKKLQRRKSEPKHRFNCPCCGRITWQDNPYDYEGCRNLNCDEWSVHA